MKTLSLSNNNFRILVMQFNSMPGQGMTLGQMRSLNTALSVLEDGISDYQAEFLVLSSDMEKLQELVKAQGAQIVAIGFEDADFTALKDAWVKLGENPIFSGVKEAREMLLTIDDAINAVV